MREKATRASDRESSVGERPASRGLRPARLEIRSMADLTTSVQYLDRNVKGRSPMSMPKDSDQEARPMDLDVHLNYTYYIIILKDAYGC